MAEKFKTCMTGKLKDVKPLQRSNELITQVIDECAKELPTGSSRLIDFRNKLNIIKTKLCTEANAFSSELGPNFKIVIESKKGEYERVPTDYLNTCGKTSKGGYASKDLPSLHRTALAIYKELKLKNKLAELK